MISWDESKRRENARYEKEYRDTLSKIELLAYKHPYSNFEKVKKVLEIASQIKKYSSRRFAKFDTSDINYAIEIQKTKVYHYNRLLEKAKSYNKKTHNKNGFERFVNESSEMLYEGEEEVIENVLKETQILYVLLRVRSEKVADDGYDPSPLIKKYPDWDINNK